MYLNREIEIKYEQYSVLPASTFTREFLRGEFVAVTELLSFHKTRA